MNSTTRLTRPRKLNLVVSPRPLLVGANPVTLRRARYLRSFALGLGIVAAGRVTEGTR
jgi:hypothetical protein